MFPEINRIRKTSTYISVFRGLNRTPNAAFSRVSSNTSAVFTEMTDMKNLCGDDFPRLRTRKPRSTLQGSMTVSNTLIANGIRIRLLETEYLIVGNERYLFEDYDRAVAMHELTLYGNRVVIMPEKYVFDLKTHEFTAIDFSFSSQGVSETELNVAEFNEGNRKKSGRTINFRDFSIEKVDLDENGVPRPVNYIYEKASGLESYEKQTNPANLDLTDETEAWQKEYFTKWRTILIGETVEAQGETPSGVYRCTDVMRKNETIDGKEYQTNNGLLRFVRIENYYVKISRNISRNDGTTDNHFAGVKKGDFVKISGMAHAVKKPMVINPDVTPQTYWAGVDGVTTGHIDYPSGYWGNYLDVLNGNTFKVYYADENCIVIKANIDRSVPYTGAMTIERVMPETDSGMLLEVSNRLWACSSANNEIYSCKQGDPTNWQAYGDGISTDSYAATVGCEGDFTGIARQNDSVIFFKENWIIKLFGTKPSNYTLTVYNVPGVERGSEKSVVWINGVLFYLSHMGVCQYSPGSQPVVISKNVFGDRKYKNGVAGRHRNKYFLSVQNELDEWELFVLDTDTGLWHKEDDTQMTRCVTYNNVLYWFDENRKFTCADAQNNLMPDSAQAESSFEWAMETPNLYDNDFGAKFISKIQLAIRAGEDTEATVYAQFRHEGAWHELKKLYFTEQRRSMTGIPVRRAAFLRLRIEGEGEMEISGIQIDFARGSEKGWQF